MAIQALVSTEQLSTVIRKMPESFTVPHFRQAFGEAFPQLWQGPVRRYGLYSSGTRYSALTHLSHRLNSYSRHERPGLLEPRPMGWKPEESSYLGHGTAEERQHFGSPCIVAYWRKRSASDT